MRCRRGSGTRSGNWSGRPMSDDLRQRGTSIAVTQVVPRWRAVLSDFVERAGWSAGRIYREAVDHAPAPPTIAATDPPDVCQ